MKFKKILFVLVLGLLAATNMSAQVGGSGADDNDSRFLPNATYEIRYWTVMSGMDPTVYIDTMYFFDNERASFGYTSPDCFSCGQRVSDSLIYVLMPKLATLEKEWDLGSNFMRRLYKVITPFRSYDRVIYKVYVSDRANKDTGMGEYAFVSREFGVILRYNAQGQQVMLNRIDVKKYDADAKKFKDLDVIDVLPLQISLVNDTDIYTGYE